MAKQDKKQGGKGHGKQNGAGGAIKGPDCAKNSAADRKTSRGEEMRLEQQRQAEIAAGTYYIRLNEDRFSDIAAACRGEIGDYAFPGGNNPSLHFNVRKEVGNQGSLAVIRFETVQRGHELEGTVFNQDTYLPAFYVEKFGLEFRSRSKDRLVASTQELICWYLADNLTEVQPTNYVGMDDSLDLQDDVLIHAKTGPESMQMMLDGRPDLYAVETERGTVTINCSGERGNLRVVASTVLGIEPSTAFLPAYLLRRETLDQVTDEVTYGHQFALFMFLRTEFPDLLTKPVKQEKVQLNASGRPMGKKELSKIVRRKQEALATANQRATEATALASMRKGAVPIRDAVMEGKMGHVDLSDSAGDLIVCFGQVGADKTIMVAHLAKNHMLRIAGVDEGHSIYVGQLMRGHVDSFEAKHMSAEDKKARDALIVFINEAMNERGFKLRKPMPHLVKKAA